MKKNSFKSLIVALSAVLISFSSGAQALMQGNFVVDAYYGFPNFGRSFSQSVEDANTSGNNFKAGGIGPAGLRLEYMIADRVGSLNSAYALLEELRDSMRFRDDVDDSITNKLQLKYSTTLLALFVLVAQTGFTMNQSQVDIIINTFASSMTDKQLDDFTAAVKEIM